MVESKTKIKRIKNVLRCITFFYFIWMLYGENIDQVYMVWNVILAWVPLELTALIGITRLKFRNRKLPGIITVLLFVLWLLFYPNSQYVMTDLIHISPYNFYIANPNYTPYSNQPRVFFNDDFKIWVNFYNIAIGVWISYIVGFISLHINHVYMEKRYNKLTGWVFIAVIQLLSGFAIYLGRFSRWNSWDIIINPYNIVSILRSSTSAASMRFTLLFGITGIVMYVLGYLISGLVMEKKG